MTETRLVVEHREQLWSLLVEAAQFEHMIMCQYLYTCFGLRTAPDECLTTTQADTAARWQETLTGIAIEEMLHLALVMNVMTAIGAEVISACKSADLAGAAHGAPFGPATVMFADVKCAAAPKSWTGYSADYEAAAGTGASGDR